MSPGMPTALPVHSVTRNFARAMHVIAATCLAGCLAILLGFETTAGLWPATVSVLLIAIALFVADRYRRTVYSVLYLAVGGACVYVVAVVTGTALSPDILALVPIVELPKLAVVLVGGIGSSGSSTVRWSIGGFAIAEVAASVGLDRAGVPWRFDWITVGGLILIVCVLVFARINRRRAAATRPRFRDAARDELVASLRARLESRAAALLHDTLLSHLAAVATTTSTAIDPELRDRMRRDLAALAGDWLRPPSVSQAEHDEWAGSPVHTAIRDARALGLVVGVSGDVTALSAIDDDRGAEVGLAVAQCLANVVHHAGTREAEVVVHRSADQVLVMVVDAGDGFVEEHGPSGRLGLKYSVRGRLEAIGGSVQVWSTPGRGTSIVLRVPVRAQVAQSPGRQIGGLAR